jgi:hypothetical protein
MPVTLITREPFSRNAAELRMAGWLGESRLRARVP